MRLRRLFVSFFASVLTLACSSADDGSPTNPGGASSPAGQPDGASPGEGGGGATNGPGETGLSCDAIAWCTSWSAASPEIVDPPELTGGTVPDGVYRLEEGTFGADAYVFEGSNVVSVGSLYANDFGTFTTSGNELTMTLTKRCDYQGESDVKNGPATYRFAVKGDDLFLAYVYDGSENPPRRYRRMPPTELCQSSATFDCGVTNGECSLSMGKGLPKPKDDALYRCH
jgi:hypothetical protein